MKTTQTTLVTCPRCSGAKKFAVYGHVANGVCFLCAGRGKVDASKLGTPNAPTVAPVPGARRQSIINKIQGALRFVREEGKAVLSEIDDSDPRAGRTVRQSVESLLALADCPADVRARAVEAFAKLGVTIAA